ncbi:hypothetical protein EJ02DRAFT_59098 [Clathrospora elynae]|uniref:Uncharacterized protein n=1 Tax=Clathrospora elynae TaxID=706981 RepID=A0A6A5T856_9PLEO|nr:hypothetical protein EJ02DRAFT_59098 [Clathrospora elynae]
MVRSAVIDDPSHGMHFDAMHNWIGRTRKYANDTATKKDGFLRLNDILKSRFGLEAIVIHEKLTDEMTVWLHVVLPHYFPRERWPGQDGRWKGFEPQPNFGAVPGRVSDGHLLLP